MLSSLAPCLLLPALVANLSPSTLGLGLGALVARLPQLLALPRGLIRPLSLLVRPLSLLAPSGLIGQVRTLLVRVWLRTPFDAFAFLIRSLSGIVVGIVSHGSMGNEVGGILRSMLPRTVGPRWELGPGTSEGYPGNCKMAGQSATERETGHESK